MTVVNIYIYQTIRGPGKKKGAYTYILETEIDEKPITLTKTGKLEPMSENKAELTTLLKALERIKKDCVINVIGAGHHIKSGLAEWLDKWIEADWINAKGKEVANKAEWQQINEYRNKYKIVIFSDQDHSYKKWMQSESEKELKNEE